MNQYLNSSNNFASTTITVYYLKTEQGSDWIDIFEASKTRSRIARWTGDLSDAVMQTITIPHGYFEIQFRSDPSVTKVGFALSIEWTCPDGSTPAWSPAGSPGCSCKAGFEVISGNCVACPAGKFKALSGNTTTCGDCNANTRSAPGASSCIACGPNSFSANGSSACSCPLGYYGDPNVMCQKCPTNTYGSGEALGVTTTSSCMNCPHFSTTNGTLGATNASSCVCIAGYYQDDYTGLCIGCPVDTYKSSNSNQECVSCPTGTSTGGNMASRNCSVCAIGYQGTAPNCQICPSGFEKPRAGNGDCTAVPKGPAPNAPTTSAAIPLASLMGVSDTIFVVIIGSVVAVILVAIGAIIVVRKRTKENKNMQQNLASVGFQGQEQNGISNAGNGFTSMMAKPAQPMLQYANSARMSTNLSGGAGAVFPLQSQTGMQQGMSIMPRTTMTIAPTSGNWNTNYQN